PNAAPAAPATAASPRAGSRASARANGDDGPPPQGEGDHPKDGGGGLPPPPAPGPDPLRRFAVPLALRGRTKVTPQPFDAAQDLRDAPRTGGRQRPKDAATLILTRRASDGLQVMMGRRAPGHVFMASKWVFPGGR